MKLYKEIEEKQKENAGAIILVKVGIFYQAIGKDAVALAEPLGLQVTCAKKEMCKIGIPVKGIKKYLEKIARFGILYNSL